MPTFTALTTLSGQAGAEALADAMERLSPPPIGIGTFEIEVLSGEVEHRRERLAEANPAVGVEHPTEHLGVQAGEVEPGLVEFGLATQGQRTAPGQAAGGLEPDGQVRARTVGLQRGVFEFEHRRSRRHGRGLHAQVEIEPQGRYFSVLVDMLRSWACWAEQTGAWPPGLRTPAFGFLEWARETAHQLDDNHTMTRDEFFGSFTTGFGVRAVKPEAERPA